MICKPETRIYAIKLKAYAPPDEEKVQETVKIEPKTQPLTKEPARVLTHTERPIITDYPSSSIKPFERPKEITESSEYMEYSKQQSDTQQQNGLNNQFKIGVGIDS